MCQLEGLLACGGLHAADSRLHAACWAHTCRVHPTLSTHSLPLLPILLLRRHMRRLTARVLWSGGLLGAAAGLAFHLARGSMPGWFTSDPAVVEALLSGGAWTVLALAQPLNGLLFVFDGLMYATQVGGRAAAERCGGVGATNVQGPARTWSIRTAHASPPGPSLATLRPSSTHPNPLQAFRYVRDYMALGFAIIFLPALALEAFVFPSLANIVSGQTRPLAWQSPPYPPWRLTHFVLPSLVAVAGQSGAQCVAAGGRSAPHLLALPA